MPRENSPSSTAKSDDRYPYTYILNIHICTVNKTSVGWEIKKIPFKCPGPELICIWVLTGCARAHRTHMATNWILKVLAFAERSCNKHELMDVNTQAAAAAAAAAANQ